MNKAKRSAKIAEALKMTGAGASQSEAARKLGVTQQTVCRWLRAAEKTGVRVSHKPQGRPRKSPPSDSGQVVSVENPELTARLTGLDIPSELAVVRAEWLPKARRQVDKALAADNSAQARDWMRIYVDTAERLLRAIPEPPPDPVDDPANLEARAEVLGHLRRLAEVRRRELSEKLCEVCRAKVLGGLRMTD